MLSQGAGVSPGSGGGDGLAVDTGGHVMRIAMALAVALITYIAFPATPVVDSPIFEVGSVATQNVISPISFRVPKDAREAAAEQTEAARAVALVFTLDPTQADSSLRLIGRYFARIEAAATGAADASRSANAVRAASDSIGIRLTAAEGILLANESQRAELQESAEGAVSGILARGVAPTGALDSVRNNVWLNRGDSARALVRPDSIITFSRFLTRARAESSVGNSAVAATLLTKILTSYFRPTIINDRAATEALRNEARLAVPDYQFEVRAQEAIVRANEVIGIAEHAKLSALRSELQNRMAGQRNAGRVAGAVLFNALLVGAFWFALFMFRPAIYGSLRSLATMSAVFTIVIVCAALVSRAPVLHPELVPIAIVAVVFSVLFDTRVSMIAAMTLAVLIGGQNVFYSSNATFLNMLAGVAGVFSVELMRQRNQAYISMVSIAGAYALAAIALGLTLDRPAAGILESILYGGVNALITVPLAMLVLPLAEEFTGIDTYPRLLEWSDLNRPLMRKLSLEAPGTYAHTMTIANLSEAACNAIGANGMLARVGSYYHDIGKLISPQYFVENQARGRNPHDQLEPQQSAAIIRGHVTGGIEMARKHKLPGTVRAFITEHHGTCPITYFLEKSTERDGPPAEPGNFHYPGPIPQSRETAVVMLADAVEASTRVLSDPTPAKIREVVRHIVKLRMDQGQLANAPLTLQDVETVSEQFIRVLAAAHHSRIDYPTASGGVTAEFAS